MAQEQEVIDLLKSMDGAIHVFKLDDGSRQKLIEIESGVRGTLNISCVNLGVEECLKRDHVIIIIKDARFRPPPEPTVLLVADNGEMIMGREVFPYEKYEYEGKSNVIFLSEDFVVFTDRFPKTKEVFMMPPVSFPEVAVLPNVTEVVSCSPSPPADMFLRAAHGLIDDPKLASIMVGYNNSSK